jgi:hypothetical protein
MAAVNCAFIPHQPDNADRGNVRSANPQAVDSCTAVRTRGTKWAWHFSQQ